MSDVTIFNSTNAEYHANTTHISSSGLKLLLKSSEDFYDKYIAKSVPNESKAVFDEGTFTHALLLEPEKVMTDFATYAGLRKAGAVYEQFAAEHKGKIILSIAQVLRCEAMAKAAQSVTLVNEILNPCAKEFTMLSTILGVPVKARADAIDIAKRYIVDVKTTSMPTDVDVFRETVEQYAYDLSASLYCQIAFDNFGELFDFYFIVLSKADNGVGVYKASSKTLSAGAAKVTTALVKYKKCLSSNDWSNNSKKHEFNNESTTEILEV